MDDAKWSLKYQVIGRVRHVKIQCHVVVLGAIFFSSIGPTESVPSNFSHTDHFCPPGLIKSGQILFHGNLEVFSLIQFNIEGKYC